jgi:hypothetical protein
MKNMTGPASPDVCSRRALLGAGLGLGALAAAQLMHMRPAFGEGKPPGNGIAGADKGVLGTGQFPARAKRVISLHMMGAPSQVDTFEYKPTLWQMHGQEIPPSVKGTARISAMSNGQSSFPIMAPLRPFKQYGACGRWVSDLMPYTARIVDDLTFVHSMHTDHVNHDPAAVFLHTGFQLPGRPCAGAWVHYALGTDNPQLPSFVVMKSFQRTSGVAANANTWGSGFLPSHHQGVEFRAGADPVLYVGNPEGVSRAARRAQLDFIRELSHAQFASTQDPEILSKVAQYEMAYRMQESVPEVADISGEPAHILAMYGPDVHKPGSYARNCLLTRRLIERGVKFVELIHVGWDDHSHIKLGHATDCKACDQPSAALVKDLQQRGLLSDTLVMWAGEFGRTCFAQGGITDSSGRDHHGGNFTMWLAGGGLRPGIAYGQTDDFSYNIVENPVSIHDLHATMLHLMGVDHTQLTYHYQGRDFRLTDVSGEAIKAIIA